MGRLTRRRLDRLQAAINRYVVQANDDPRPFRWTNIAQLGRKVRIVGQLELAKPVRLKAFWDSHGSA
ncbi:MAG: hypothetical protein NVS2B11_09920 [Acetobacteraceae bacterium]